MPIQYQEDCVVLQGTCGIRELEDLQAFFQLHENPVVSFEGCQHLHTALLQLLLTYRPQIRGNAESAFIARWIVPLLDPKPTLAE